MTSDASLSTANFIMVLSLELVAFGLVIVVVVFGALLLWDWLTDRWGR